MVKPTTSKPIEPNFFQARGVPIESKEQRASMQLAAKISKSPSCLERHFKSTAYAIKAVAISFFNAFYYAGRSLVRFTICIVHCEGKKAFQQLGSGLSDAGKSLFLVAISVFYVGGGLLFPQTVYCFFAPVDSTAASESSSALSSTESTDDKKVIDKLQDFESRQKALELQLSQLQDAKRSAQSELDRLRASPSDGKSVKDSTRKIQTLDQQIEKIKESIKLLNAERNAYIRGAKSKDENATIESLKASLKASEETVKELREKLAKSTGLSPEELNKLLSDNTSVKAGFKEQLDAAQAILLEQLTAIQKTEAQLQEKLAALEAQLKKVPAGSSDGCLPPGGVKPDKKDDKKLDNLPVPASKPKPPKKLETKPNLPKLPGGPIVPNTLNLGGKEPIDLKALGLSPDLIGGIGFGLGGTSKLDPGALVPQLSKDLDEKDQSKSQKLIDSFDPVPKAKKLAEGQGQGNAMIAQAIAARLQDAGGDASALQRLETSLVETGEKWNAFEGLANTQLLLVKEMSNLTWTSAKRDFLLKEIATVFNGQGKGKLLQLFPQHEAEEILEMLESLSRGSNQESLTKIKALPNRILSLLIHLKEEDRASFAGVLSPKFFDCLNEYLRFIAIANFLYETCSKVIDTRGELQVSLYGSATNVPDDDIVHTYQTLQKLVDKKKTVLEERIKATRDGLDIEEEKGGPAAPAAPRGVRFNANAFRAQPKTQWEHYFKEKGLFDAYKNMASPVILQRKDQALIDQYNMEVKSLFEDLVLEARKNPTARTFAARDAINAKNDQIRKLIKDNGPESSRQQSIKKFMLALNAKVPPEILAAIKQDSGIDNIDDPFTLIDTILRREKAEEARANAADRADEKDSKEGKQSDGANVVPLAPALDGMDEDGKQSDGANVVPLAPALDGVDEDSKDDKPADNNNANAVPPAPASDAAEPVPDAPMAPPPDAPPI